MCHDQIKSIFVQIIGKINLQSNTLITLQYAFKFILIFTLTRMRYRKN